MDAFAGLKSDERRLYFEETATPRNMNPQIIEKDFWVCWILKALFQLQGIGGHLIFKGGTSLSKVFKVIERFSEDVDISMERTFLGFGGANEPEAGVSNKEKQRRIEALKIACQEKINLVLLPALKASIQSKVRRGEKWLLYSDHDDPDGQTLLFDYPTSFTSDEDAYIQRTVKIEMGARSDHWPCEIKVVAPYVAEQFPSGFRESSCEVRVLSVERTFWEKATILHAEYHRPMEKPIPERFSRHYCDFYELIQKGIARKALDLPDLLHRVSRHKALFFKSSWAKYEEAIRGTLRIVPPGYRFKALKDDYKRMQEMFFGKSPKFDQMMDFLESWELEFNQR